MKFALISDTHIGAALMMFMQQQGYPEHMEEAVSLLAERLKSEEAEFLLHAGDIIDSTTIENIKTAEHIFSSLDIPVFATVGNHDLTELNAASLWLQYGTRFFPNGEIEFTIKKDNLFIHALSTHWQDEPYYWSTKQNAHILPERMREIEAALAADPGAFHILLTHSPVFAIPDEQTGFGEGFHSAGEAFKTELTTLAAKFPQLRCILSGHNHVNTRINQNGVDYITASAFAETPFEFKLFDFTDGKLKMETKNLSGSVGFETVYNYNKTYVQGRAKDRAF